jgi:oxygen-independent coproporphyrinogen-3 oxidase
MINMITKEITTRRNEFSGESIETIYFGGGTPSLLTIQELELILQAIYSSYEVTNDAEITLEANPEDISPDSLKVWRKVGVNRLSIGIQSFREQDLQWMNRSHTAEQSKQAVEWAQKAGFTNITIDLIYGLPNLSIADWENHLQMVFDLSVDHISAYCLTIEEGTALNNWVKKGKIHPAGEEIQSKQFDCMIELMGQNGYEQYEISNFARDQKYSKHNSAYWTGRSYLGFGPSAHSFDGISRRWNISNNAQYMQGLETENNYFETEELSHQDRWNELIMTGLRTKFGVDLQTLYSLFPPDEEFMQTLTFWEEQEMLTIQNQRILLTPQGKILADRIASELFKTN